jgi:GR25 family glycosyltransferase involved in LPS biosynthesis
MSEPEKRCAIYCLNYANQTRFDAMFDKWHRTGTKATMFAGVPTTDPRIAGRGLSDHTAKCWSCMIGHLDMIRTYLEETGPEIGCAVFCEDDIMIDADFRARLDHVIDDFEALGLDTLLLGYLTMYPIVGEDNAGYPKLGYSHYVDVDSGRATQYNYYDYGDVWGTQMYMLSRAQAERILEKYGNDYGDRFLANPEGHRQFSADWTITKEGRRAIVYPMLAIEDGLSTYDDYGQRVFHQMSHESHKDSSNYI